MAKSKDHTTLFNFKCIDDENDSTDEIPNQRRNFSGLLLHSGTAMKIAIIAAGEKYPSLLLSIVYNSGQQHFVLPSTASFPQPGGDCSCLRTAPVALTSTYRRANSFVKSQNEIPNFISGPRFLDPRLGACGKPYRVQRNRRIEEEAGQLQVWSTCIWRKAYLESGACVSS